MNTKLARKRLEDLNIQVNNAIDCVGEAETALEKELQIALQVTRENRDKQCYSIKCTFFSFVSLFATNSSVSPRRKYCGNVGID